MRRRFLEDDGGKGATRRGLRMGMQPQMMVTFSSMMLKR